jgi:hypothetical protein
MWINSIIISIIIASLATNASSNSSIQCEPALEVFWSYDHLNKTSEFRENTDNLSNIILIADHGFLKLSVAENKKLELFRQNSITNNTEDMFDITVGYESTDQGEIDKTSIILSDPMCKTDAVAIVSILNTREFGFKNAVYNCDCLSATHDSDNFIYEK